jgi:hypothetical protein
MSNSVYKTVRYSCGIGKNTAFLDIKNYLDGTTTAVVARENTEGENFPLSVEDKLLIAGEFDAELRNINIAENRKRPTNISMFREGINIILGYALDEILEDRQKDPDAHSRVKVIMNVGAMRNFEYLELEYDDNPLPLYFTEDTFENFVKYQPIIDRVYMYGSDRQEVEVFGKIGEISSVPVTPSCRDISEWKVLSIRGYIGYMIMKAASQNSLSKELRNQLININRLVNLKELGLATDTEEKLRKVIYNPSWLYDNDIYDLIALYTEAMRDIPDDRTVRETIDVIENKGSEYVKSIWSDIDNGIYDHEYSNEDFISLIDKDLSHLKDVLDDNERAKYTLPPTIAIKEYVERLLVNPIPEDQDFANALKAYTDRRSNNYTDNSGE